MRASHLFVVAALLVPNAAAAEDFKNAGYLNAGYLNAGYLNAGYLNAGYLNAGYLNAGYLNGGDIGGYSLAKMKTAQNQTINNVQVVRDHLVGEAWVQSERGLWSYQELEGIEFLNATFQITVNDASTDQLSGYLTAKITDIITKTVDGVTVYQHVVKYQDAQSMAWKPACGCENNNPSCTKPIPATLQQGLWNYTSGTIDGGKKISNDPNLVTLACGQAAISKCAADQAWKSPLTPYYYGSISGSWTWIHKGAWIVYPGETITVKLTNVSGDPDLYVRWNDQATATLYNCRKTEGAGVSETCTMTVPNSAYYAYISTYAYGASSATLTVSATNAAPRGLGYKPYSNGMLSCSYVNGYFHCDTSPSSQHQACTRMVTADYCGDGTSHTVSGTAIDVFDFYNPIKNVQEESSVAEYKEAEWTAAGASWLLKCRWDELDLSDADPYQCPVYDNNGTPFQHDVLTLPPSTTYCPAPGPFQFQTQDDRLYNNTGENTTPRLRQARKTSYTLTAASR